MCSVRLYARVRHVHATGQSVSCVSIRHYQAFRPHYQRTDPILSLPTRLPSLQTHYQNFFLEHQNPMLNIIYRAHLYTFTFYKSESELVFEFVFVARQSLVQTCCSQSQLFVANNCCEFAANNCEICRSKICRSNQTDERSTNYFEQPSP